MDVEKASSTVLFCFQHCRKDINVICFSLPKSCPVCENDIGNSRLLVPLYRLPNPFSGAELSPHCLLIKPTKGSFLQLVIFFRRSMIFVMCMHTDNLQWLLNRKRSPCWGDRFKMWALLALQKVIITNWKTWLHYRHHISFQSSWFN